MKVIVPDASIILKWVLPAVREPHLEQALSLRDAFVDGLVQLLLPSLWFYEVGNILTLKYAGDAPQRLESLVRMRITEARPSAQWRESIIELVQNYHVTFYDAAYHALALVRNGVFVTADQKYIDKVGDEKCVTHVGDWTAASE